VQSLPKVAFWCFENAISASSARSSSSCVWGAALPFATMMALSNSSMDRAAFMRATSDPPRMESACCQRIPAPSWKETAEPYQESSFDCWLANVCCVIRRISFLSIVAVPRRRSLVRGVPTCRFLKPEKYRVLAGKVLLLRNRFLASNYPEIRGLRNYDFPGLQA